MHVSIYFKFQPGFYISRYKERVITYLEAYAESVVHWLKIWVELVHTPLN